MRRVRLFLQSLLCIIITIVSCQKEVSEPIMVSAVNLNADSVELTEGEEFQLVATISPNNADNKVVIWSTSNASVASVLDGKVTAIKAGKATITVKSDDGGKTATCDVVVNAMVCSVTSVSLSQTTIEMTEGDEVVLTATVSPENATNKNVKWNSSDSSVATVVDGKITALKSGTATVTVTTEDGGKTANCEVTVSALYCPVESVSLNQSAIEMAERDQVTLVATVLPEKATNKNVIWNSSDTSVATVADGVVTALNVGYTTITATTEDAEKTAICDITVSKYVQPYTLSIDKTQIEASGVDYVNFSLKDAKGRDILTDTEELRKVSIREENGLNVPRMETKISFIDNGTYKFTASYMGVNSNTVTVQAVNRGKYEMFHKNVALFVCRSAMEPYSSQVDLNYSNVNKDAAEHSVYISVHAWGDPFTLYYGQQELVTYLMSKLRADGALPSLIYDLYYLTTNRTVSDIQNDIRKRRFEAPATCGFKVTSVNIEGNALKVKATMKTSAAGDYDLACAVMQDGLYYGNGYSAYGDGIYNNVLIAMSESGVEYVNGETLQVNQEYTEEFSFDFGTNIPSSDYLKSLYVVVYAHRKTNTGSVIDNIVTCNYGSTVDYMYN